MTFDRVRIQSREDRPQQHHGQRDLQQVQAHKYNRTVRRITEDQLPCHQRHKHQSRKGHAIGQAPPAFQPSQNSDAAGDPQGRGNPRSGHHKANRNHDQKAQGPDCAHQGKRTPEKSHIGRRVTSVQSRQNRTKACGLTLLSSLTRRIGPGLSDFHDVPCAVICALTLLYMQSLHHAL